LRVSSSWNGSVYVSGAILMLPDRPFVSTPDKLPALFRDLKEAGLRDWSIEPNPIDDRLGVRHIQRHFEAA